MIYLSVCLSVLPATPTWISTLRTNTHTSVARRAPSRTIMSSSNTTHTSTQKSPLVQANALWQKMPKANAELFALTYGALVGELLVDMEDSAQIQKELDRMGHSIGVRCIEEYLAKSSIMEGDVKTVTSFADTADLLKVALKMFLGVLPDVSAHEPNNKYTLIFHDNPLALFVELPSHLQLSPEHKATAQGNANQTTTQPNSGNHKNNNNALEYNQLLAGMIRGMLEQLQFDVDAKFTASQLRGDETNEIEVTLNQVLQEGAGDDYQEE